MCYNTTRLTAVFAIIACFHVPRSHVTTLSNADNNLKQQTQFVKQRWRHVQVNYALCSKRYNSNTSITRAVACNSIHILLPSNRDKGNTHYSLGQYIQHFPGPVFQRNVPGIYIITMTKGVRLQAM